MLQTIIIIVLIAAAVMGWRRGLLSQLGSMAAVILALIASRGASSGLEGAFTAFVPDSLHDTVVGSYIASTLASVAVFVAVYLGVRLVVKALNLIVKSVMMGPINRLAGAAFNVVEWAIGLSVAINLIVAVSPDGSVARQADPADGSPLVSTVASVAPWFWGSLDKFEQAEKTSDASNSLEEHEQ